MWLFRDQQAQEAAISIWSIPLRNEDQIDANQKEHWVVKGRKLKEEVLIFVQHSICYTLLEYIGQESEEECLSFQLVPDIVFPRN